MNVWDLNVDLGICAFRQVNEPPSIGAGQRRELLENPRAGLEMTVWPIWQRLFDEIGVPCDELTAPPAEFARGLEMLRRAEPELGV